MGSSKKSRREKKERARLKNLEITEKTLAIKCPVPRCKAGPNVWCGPVLERAVFQPINPWMHEERYRKANSDGLI